MSKQENKPAQPAKVDIDKAIAAIKANPELLNALKADAEISASISDLKSEFAVEVNRYGDIHFKKAMLQSLEHFAGLKAKTPLKMVFEQGKIVIVPAKTK